MSAASQKGDRASRPVAKAVAAVLALSAQTAVGELETDRGFVLFGIADGDFSGTSVSEGGDVNGDGLPDLLIGANGADPGDRGRAGETYVVFGRSSPYPAVVELAELLPEHGGDGTAGFVVAGVDAGDEAGIRLTTAGDVNGDGLDDILVGAFEASYGDETAAGAAYVVFGSLEPFPAVVELATLLPANGGDGSRGFVMTGADPGDFAGYSVARAGDVNGDGIADLLVGAVSADPGNRQNAGEAYVVYGRTDGFQARLPLGDLQPGNGGDGTQGFVLNGVDPFDEAGRTVSWVGDVNGDGTDDFMTAAMRADPGGRIDAGEISVMFGRAGGFPAAFELADLLPENGGDGSEGFVLAGVGKGDIAGNELSGVGDLNADGYDDLLVAAPFADPPAESAGEVYVIFGRAGFGPQLELGELLPARGGDGSEGFVIRADEINALTRVAVSDAGDVNADGLADLIVGGEHADTGPGGEALAGRSYVIFGRLQGFPPLVPLARLLPENGGTGALGFVLDGIDANDNSGASVSTAGDMNGDGIDDLIVGAERADVRFGYSQGESYVIYGDAGGFPPVFELGTLLPLAMYSEGACPGFVEVELQGLTPDALFAVLGSDAEGETPVPNAPCGEVITGLENPELLGVRRARDNGRFDWRENLPEPFPICGQYVQVLDLATCTLTNVVRIPD